MKQKILKAARVIRSKNSGPFELTLDIMFKNRQYFECFRRGKIITRRKIAGLYGVSPKDILGIIYFEPACAVKITLRRPLPSGAPGDTDIYGAQQHAPLLNLKFHLTSCRPKT